MNFLATLNIQPALQIPAFLLIDISSTMKEEMQQKCSFSVEHVKNSCAHFWGIQNKNVLFDDFLKIKSFFETKHSILRSM